MVFFFIVLYLLKLSHNIVFQNHFSLTKSVLEIEKIKLPTLDLQFQILHFVLKKSKNKSLTIFVSVKRKRNKSWKTIISHFLT